ncbi:hypothetical protein JCM16303_000255 [Sporobolomyces ruberrimus]
MSHPYAIPTTGPTGSPSTASPSTTNTTTRSPSTTTQSPGSVNRKLVVDPVHGHTREETREERRTRKDRERQLRDSSTALPPPPIPSSSSSASSSRVNLQNAASTSTSSKSVLTIALQRAQSAVLLDSANNFPAAISAYSQSVRLLKEVMARVESKGVEMERKGSTGSVVSTMSGASSGTLTRRDNESNDEWEKRKSRWDKKEKAKADEARRLKVIHDTYEDRIKMLLAMNPSLASATSPSIAAAVLPASTSNSSRLGGGGGNESSSPASPTTASMRFHRRRSSTELPEMSPTSTESRTHRSTPSSSSAHSLSGPTSPTALAGVGAAMLSSNLASPTSPSALSSSSSNGIPRIAQLPIISPSNSLNNLSNLATSSSHDPSYLSHLNPSSTSNRPLSTASDSTAKALPLSGTVTPTAPSAPTSILPRPLPPPTTSLPPPPPPDHPPPPIPSTVGNRNSASSGSSQGEDQRIPVTALDYGEDWPREGEDGEGQREELRLPVVDRDPVGSSQLGEGTRGSPVSPPRHPPPVFPAHKTGSTPPRSFPLTSTNSSPMRRGSSASAVYTLQSHSRPPTNSFSSYNNASNMPGSSGGGEGSASMMMRRTMSSEGPNPSSILRPMRSASLASQGQAAGTGPQVYSSGMVPSLSAGSHHSTNSSFSIGIYARSITPAGTMTPVTNLATAGGNEDGLVSQSTAGGTISQRRFAGGLTTGQGEGSTPTSSSGQQLEATIVVRAPSQESYRSSQAQVPSQSYDEFGSNVPSNRTSGGTGGGGFGSLPGRLRALSQPSQKRPKLPTNHSGSWIADSSTASNSPPVPPLLSQTPSSASSTSTAHRHHLPSLSISSTTSSGGALSRKPSVPTPTTLNAPPFPATLGRSNSSSSVGSSASGRYSDRSLPPPVPSSATTASNLSLHAQSTPSSNYGIPSPPNRSSASSRETVMSIPPVRRPFHLMRLVVATMPNPATSPITSRSSVISLAPSASGGGGYLSEKLYVPSQIWSIPGSKLVAIETKVRMMEIVLSSLSQLSTSGQSLLSPALANTARNSGSGGERWCVDEATRFMRELESFEGVVEGVQNTLAKKLGGGLINPTGGGIGNSAFNDKEFGGFGTGGAGGKDAVGGGIGSGSGKDARKGSTAGGQFASWSSKFQRGFDRVTNANGVSLDSQATYVETVARLFRQSQCIDHHLALLLSTSSSSTSQNEVSAYSLLPLSERHRLERHLRRASEFFGTVVCRFVMKDVGLLLDKYVKRGGAWLSGE